MVVLLIKAKYSELILIFISYYLPIFCTYDLLLEFIIRYNCDNETKI